MSNLQKEFPLEYLLNYDSVNAENSQYQADSMDNNGYRRSLQMDSFDVANSLVNQAAILNDAIRRANQAKTKYRNGDVNREYLNYFTRINQRKLDEINALLAQG